LLFGALVPFSAGAVDHGAIYFRGYADARLGDTFIIFYRSEKATGSTIHLYHCYDVDCSQKSEPCNHAYTANTFYECDLVFSDTSVPIIAGGGWQVMVDTDTASASIFPEPVRLVHDNSVSGTVTTSNMIDVDYIPYGFGVLGFIGAAMLGVMFWKRS